MIDPSWYNLPPSIFYRGAQDGALINRATALLRVLAAQDYCEDQLTPSDDPPGPHLSARLSLDLLLKAFPREESGEQNFSHD